MSRPRIPSYRLHKASGQAIIKFGGRFHYLVKFGSPESHRAYTEKLKEWFDAQNGQPFPAARLTIL